jgi:hypothetical protein
MMLGMDTEIPTPIAIATDDEGREIYRCRVIKIVKKKRELFLGQRLMSLCSLTLP